MRRGEHARAREASAVVVDGAFLGHTGFFAVPARGGRTNQFFAWYQPCAACDEGAPLLHWFNGGPGSPDTVGALDQIGRFGISRASRVRRRCYTWCARAHCLFVDQPVGAGYSFQQLANGSVADEPLLTETSEEAAAQVLAVLCCGRGSCGRSSGRRPVTCPACRTRANTSRRWPSRPCGTTRPRAAPSTSGASASGTRPSRSRGRRLGTRPISTSSGSSTRPSGGTASGSWRTRRPSGASAATAARPSICGTACGTTTPPGGPSSIAGGRAPPTRSSPSARRHRRTSAPGSRATSGRCTWPGRRAPAAPRPSRRAGPCTRPLSTRATSARTPRPRTGSWPRPASTSSSTRARWTRCWGPPSSRPPSTACGARPSGPRRGCRGGWPRATPSPPATRGASGQARAASAS
mmetsp:Transcript_21395/g.63961  ORF Transcript_21395/g.63961 Transcript_21395/m.63961 type:complete len:408 (+) Transcript_21395:392-1615(+)